MNVNFIVSYFMVQGDSRSRRNGTGTPGTDFGDTGDGLKSVPFYFKSVPFYFKSVPFYLWSVMIRIECSHILFI